MYHPKYHVEFYDKLPNVTLTREGSIKTNWTDLVKQSSQEIMPKDIDLKDIWFTTDLEDNPSKFPNNELSV